MSPADALAEGKPAGSSFTYVIRSPGALVPDTAVVIEALNPTPTQR